MHEPSQKAIIHWFNGNETLFLQVKYEGLAENFGWIVPLPAEPKVTAIDADKSPFAELSLHTQSREHRGRKGYEPENDVTILQRKIVGVYDIAVLASKNNDALSDWLIKNGFSFPKDKSVVLEHYIKKNWIYVAMKIETGSLKSNDAKKLKTGELQPIRFSFPSEEMVYPLKISSVNAGETELLLYLLADAPMVLETKNQPNGFSIERNLGRYVTASKIDRIDLQYGTHLKVKQETLPLTWDALGIPAEKSLSLCKYKAVYTPERMTEDLVFSVFSPISYWTKHFSLEVIDISKYRTGHEYKIENNRQRACAVLSYYDPALLEKLARNKHRSNRELAAIHPNTPEKLLIKLAQDKESMVKHNLVWNKKLPPGALRILAKDNNEHLRAKVAGHPNTPFDLLDDFVVDKSRYVRNSVMRHPEVTLEILKKLLDDPDPIIRSSLAYKDIPTNWLIKLSKDKNQHVRAAVAKQTNLPGKLVKKLIDDNSPEVRRKVAFVQKLPAKTLLILSNDSNMSVRSAVAHNSKTSAKILRKLAKDSEFAVRSSVANNPNTPDDVLLYLAEDDEYWVRYCVAGNRNTLRKILIKLSEDENSKVSQQAKSSLANREK